MAVFLRFATLHDIDKLISIRFDYFDTEGWKLAKDKRISIKSQLRQYYRKHLNHDFFAALAETENASIASAAFLVIAEKPANLSFPTGKIGTVLNVLTYPKFRRMGYATQVLKLLIDKSVENDLSFIELSASELGKPLYEKLGFQKMKDLKFTRMKLIITD